MTVRASRIAVAAVAAIVALIPVLGIAASAQAHNYLVSSTPKADETLTALPPSFVITTNDVLLNIDGKGAGFAIEVTDAAGKYYGDGCVSIEGPAMSMKSALGAAGKYRVTWQAVSTDGHTVSDVYDFTWQPPKSFAPAAGSLTAPDCNGTLSPQAKSSAGQGPSTSREADSGALETVLWIGGAFLAVALAVILTLFFALRKKRPADEKTMDE